MRDEATNIRAGGGSVPFKIVRNDITKMNTEAIVNTANARATVETGCDSAVYKAAGKVYHSCSKSAIYGR